MKNDKKIRRMVEIARMYYEDDIKQEDIAKILDISRPLVSKILAEAKGSGIVTINIKSPLDERHVLESELVDKFGLKSVVVVDSVEDKNLTNIKIYNEAASMLNKLMQQKNTKAGNNMEKFNVGLGWGDKVYYSLSEITEMNSYLGNTCALIGNFPSLNITYHSNEIIRMFSDKTETKPEYVYAPAFFSSMEEKHEYENTGNVNKIVKLWNSLDIAVIGVENYPSIADFTSIANFRDKLNHYKAVGEVVNHYFDADGNIIEDINDNTMHIPISLLKQSKRILAITAEDTRLETVLGLIRSKLATDMVITKKLAIELVKI